MNNDSLSGLVKMSDITYPNNRLLYEVSEMMLLNGDVVFFWNNFDCLQIIYEIILALKDVDQK